MRLGRTDRVDRVPGRDRGEQTTDECVRQAASGHHAAGHRVGSSSGQEDADQREHAGDGDRAAGRKRPRRPGHGDVEQSDDENHGRDREATATGCGAAPRSPGPARAASDDFDNVVVRQLRPVQPTGHEMEQLSVADVLYAKAAGGIELGAGSAPQRPATVLFAVFREIVAGMPQQVRQQLGDQHVFG